MAGAYTGEIIARTEIQDGPFAEGQDAGSLGLGSRVLDGPNYSLWTLQIAKVPALE